MIIFFKKWFFLFLLLTLFVAGIDEWTLERIETDVRDTLETAEQAAIIKAMDANSMIYVEKQNVGFDSAASEQAFIAELQRGLRLDGNLKPTGRWLKDFELSYLDIGMADNQPSVTAGVKVRAKLMVAPLIGYKSDTIKANLADRHTTVWK